MRKNDFYRFGEFKVEVEYRRLWHGEDLVPLTPKEFKVLFFLVEREGKIAEKNDLLDEIWTDAFVEEATLARNVSWLRKKLAKFSDELFIETVPKRGYRFVADVEYLEQDDNLIIIEEQTTQLVEIEERITQEPSETLQENSTKVLLPRENIKKTHFLKNPKFLWLLVGLVSVFGIGYFIYKSNNSKPQVVFLQNGVRLSDENGSGGSPSFSPDGKKLVYSSVAKSEQIGNIFLRSIEKDEPIRLTNSRYWEFYPKFSPNGKQVAFLRQIGENGEIHLVSVNGGETRFIRKVFSARFSMSFSPDGKSLAHVDTPSSKMESDFEIYVTDIESRVRRRLVEFPNQFRGQTTPRYSPDGKSIAFIGEYRDAGKKDHDVFVVSAKGGKPRQITTEGIRVHSIAWSGDGQTIYYVLADSQGGPSQLKRISLSGGEPEFVYVGGGGISNIAISKDGKKIAVQQSNPKGLILQLMKNGEPPKKLIYSNKNNHTPQFLPGRKRFLFISDSKLFLANNDGEVIKQILPDSVENIHNLRVSNDGSHILFLGRINGTDGIHTATVEGENIRSISDEMRYLRKYPFSSINPVWSADDKWIYFASKRTGQYEIWKIKTDGSGEAKQITKNGGFRAIPLSDNKTIYFRKLKSPDNKIWQISTEGGEEKSVSGFKEAGYQHNALWTKTKDGIYFFIQKDGSFQLRFFDFANKTFNDVEGNYRIPQKIVITEFVTNGEDLIASGRERARSYITLADLPN